jgi:hypothetical protein
VSIVIYNAFYNGFCSFGDFGGSSGAWSILSMAALDHTSVARTVDLAAPVAEVILS